MTVDLVVLPDAGWAAHVAERLSTSISPGARVCLPTGATTTPLYRRPEVVGSLGQAELFLLDEFGGLPRGDPGRCLSMLRRDLLDHMVSQPALHFPEVDSSDRDAAASRYGDLVRSDRLHLALAGLGGNGHVGMNEPGSSATSVTRVVELADVTKTNAAGYGATIEPTWGITVGLAELMAARSLWLLVTGAHKRRILESALTAPVGPDLPATFLRDHPGLVVFADESAAGAGGGLRRPSPGTGPGW